MGKMHKAALAGLLAAQAVTASSWLRVSIANYSTFEDPTIDPFYDAPDNLTAYAAGDVIRSRPVDTIFNATNAQQILYRTNNNFDVPVATVATVFEPTTPSTSSRILSYQDPEDSPQLDCAPSWALVEGSNSTNAPLLASLGKIIYGFADALGAHLVISDFEGPNATWIVGRMEGHGTLDGIRATSNYYNMNNASVAMTGYSGGAHATVWALSLAATYAPELNIVGSAFGGTPTDLLASLYSLNGTANALLAIGSLVGLADGYPELNATYNQYFTDTGRNVSSLMHRNNYCVTSFEADFANFNIESMFTNGAAILNNSVVQAVLANETLLMNASSFDVPVPTSPRFEWHGLADEIIPYWSESAYVEQQCQKGANIIFNSYANQSHTGAAVAGLSDAMAFIGNAFNGTLPTVTCGQSYPSSTMASARRV